MGNTTSTDVQSESKRNDAAGPKHRKLQSLIVDYLFQTDPGVRDARKEYPVSEKLPADVCIVRKDGTEVVEVEPNIEPYIRIEVAVKSYEDACSKFGEIEAGGLVNEKFVGQERERIERGKYNPPEHFRFVPKGDMHEVKRKLESMGWSAEASCRMNKLVRKFRNMGGGADRFSLLVPYHDEASLNTFIGELERYELPVFRIYLSSENGDGIVGFREVGGGKKTCQR